MSKPAFSLGDLQQGAKSLNNAPEIRKKDSAKGDDEGEENIARLSKLTLWIVSNLLHCLWCVVKT